jgi:hypothetical protein
LSEKPAENRDTSRAQSFGNSPEKTRTRRRPAIAKEGGQSKTPEATAAQGQAGKASAKTIQDNVCAQEVWFREEFLADAARREGIKWRGRCRC